MTSRKMHCQACTNEMFGVKTRKQVSHTCGKENTLIMDKKTRAVSEVNNFEQIREFLRFDSEDDFYFLQIIKRKKEHPDMPKSVKVVHTFYITSIEKLDELEDEIKHICEYHNARAYINLNKRSFERIAFQMLKQVTDCIMNREYRYIRKSFNTCCGRFSNEKGKDKKWILDIDNKDFDEVGCVMDAVIEAEGVVLDTIETKNGVHIITTPFRTDVFRENYPKALDIHKDNPTILYCV